MTETKSSERIARVMAALMSGDPARMEELIHPEIVLEQAASLPYGGIYTGYAGLRELGERLLATWSDFRATTESVIGDPSGDHFVLIQRVSGRSRRSGRPFEISILELFSFREGRLAEIRPHYWDTNALIELHEGR